MVFIPYQDKADLIYSLNAGDVHWCVNAKGIKGVSCPSKAYGIMAASKPILGVLESGSEVRCLIEDTHGGLCCEPGEYDKNTIIKAKFQRIKSVSIGKSPTFEGSMKIMVDVTSVIVIGNQLHMRGPLYLKALAGGKLEVGDTCFFNHNCSITCMKKVKIGSNCKFGNNLVIVDHDHNYKHLGVDEEYITDPIQIGNVKSFDMEKWYVG